MRGHQPLIEMRMKRQKPDVVFLNDFSCDVNWQEFDDAVTICTHGDILQTLDLRFLVGLTVSISGATEQRAKQLFDMVKSAGAEVVAACHVKENESPYSQTGWAEIWQKECVNLG